MNEAVGWRKRKDGLVVKAAECSPGRTGFYPCFCHIFLSDTGQVTKTKLFKLHVPQRQRHLKFIYSTKIWETPAVGNFVHISYMYPMYEAISSSKRERETKSYNSTDI